MFIKEEQTILAKYKVPSCQWQIVMFSKAVNTSSALGVINNLNDKRK